MLPRGGYIYLGLCGSNHSHFAVLIRSGCDLYHVSWWVDKFLFSLWCGGTDVCVWIKLILSSEITGVRYRIMQLNLVNYTMSNFHTLLLYPARFPSVFSHS